jgi:hypothetical protein
MLNTKLRPGALFREVNFKKRPQGAYWGDAFSENPGRFVQISKEQKSFLQYNKA